MNKIELFVEPVSKRITGYNTIPIIVENDAHVYIDDDGSLSLSELKNHKYYYIDGHVVKDDNREDMTDSLTNLYEKSMDIESILKDEEKIFMDAIMSGKDIDEARSIVQEKRDQYADIQKKIKDLEKSILNEVYKSYQQPECKYYLSILLLIKNENEYVVEWLDHYFDRIGVDHVYIYDNESGTSVESYLKKIKYPHLGKITFVSWASTSNTQQDAYNHFLKTYATETKWMATIDSDEFVEIVDPSTSLKDWLKENERYSLIECTWRTYTANGQIRKKEGLVQERFTTPAKNFSLDNQGKEFVQPELISHYVRHTPVPKQGCLAWRDINEIDKYFYLKHYYTKSYEEWCKKIFARGSCDPNALWNFQIFFVVNPDLAHISDGKDFLQTYTQVKN